MRPTIKIAHSKAKLGNIHQIQEEAEEDEYQTLIEEYYAKKAETRASRSNYPRKETKPSSNRHESARHLIYSSHKQWKNHLDHLHKAYINIVSREEPRAIKEVLRSQMTKEESSQRLQRSPDAVVAHRLEEWSASKDKDLVSRFTLQMSKAKELQERSKRLRLLYGLGGQTATKPQYLMPRLESAGHSRLSLAPDVAEERDHLSLARLQARGGGRLEELQRRLEKRGGGLEGRQYAEANLQMLDGVAEREEKRLKQLFEGPRRKGNKVGGEEVVDRYMEAIRAKFGFLEIGMGRNHH